MKALLVGIGSFGAGWYRNLKTNYPHIQLAVVDRDPRMAERLSPLPDPFYTDFQAALDAEQPDFVLNVTPPHIHTAINHQAFDRRLPVLCEKPIAEDYAEAEEIVARAVREGIPFMIAENYRRSPAFRLARRMLAAGAIGELSAIYVQFFKETYYEKQYLLNMPDPLLQDVTVHHLDLLRYLTGGEAERILAHSFNPRGSRYPGNAALNLWIEMQAGVLATYAGSMVCKDHQTGWNGEWRLEGTRGVLLVADEVRLVVDGQQQTFNDFSEVDSSTVLDEFLAALAAGREPETSGRDYLNTQKLVHLAQQSARSRSWLSV